MATLDDMRRWFPEQFGGLSDEQAVSKIQGKLGGSWDSVADQFGYEAPKGTVGGRLKDTAIDLGRGVVGIGKAAAGLGSLATGGLVGKGLDAIGYDPNRTDEALSSNYSDARKAAEARVDSASGALGKAKAYLQNPSVLIGQGVQALPTMLAPEAGAEAVAARLGEGALETAAGRGAVFTGQAAANAAQVAGQTAEDVREQNPADTVGMYAGAATAGGLTGLADRALSLLPGGALASSVATRGATSTASRGVVARSLLAGANQGALGAAMGAAQQAGANVGEGKPFGQGVPEAAGAGLVSGGVMGAAVGALHSPRSLLDRANDRTPIADESTTPTPDLSPPAPQGGAAPPDAGTPPVTPPVGAAVPPGPPADNRSTPVGTPRPEVVAQAQAAAAAKAPERAPNTEDEMARVLQRHGPIGDRTQDDGSVIPGKRFDGQDYDPGPKGDAKLQKAIDKIIDEHRNEHDYAADVRDAYAMAFKKATDRLPSSKELHSATDWAHGIKNDDELSALVTAKVREFEQDAAKKSTSAEYNPEMADTKVGAKAVEYRTLVALKETLTGEDHAPEDFSALTKAPPGAKNVADAKAGTSAQDGSAAQDAGSGKAADAQGKQAGQAASSPDVKQEVRVSAGPDDAHQEERDVTQAAKFIRDKLSGEGHEGSVQPDVRGQVQADARAAGRGAGERGVEQPAAVGRGKELLEGKRSGAGSEGASGEGSDAAAAERGAGDLDRNGEAAQPPEVDDKQSVIALLKAAVPKTADAIVDRHINGLTHSQIAEKYGKSVSWSEKSTKLQNIRPAVEAAAKKLGVDPKQAFEALTRERKVTAHDEKDATAQSTFGKSMDEGEAAEAGLNATGGKKGGGEATSATSEEEARTMARDKAVERWQERAARAAEAGEKAPPPLSDKDVLTAQNRAAGAFRARQARLAKVEEAGGPKPPNAARDEAARAKKEAQAAKEAEAVEAIKKEAEAAAGKKMGDDRVEFDAREERQAKKDWDALKDEVEGWIPLSHLEKLGDADNVFRRVVNLWKQFSSSFNADTLKLEQRYSPERGEEDPDAKMARVAKSILQIASDYVDGDRTGEATRTATKDLKDVEFIKEGSNTEAITPADFGTVTELHTGTPERDKVDEVLHRMTESGHGLEALHDRIFVSSHDGSKFLARVGLRSDGKYGLMLTQGLLDKGGDRLAHAIFHEMHHVLEDASAGRYFSRSPEFQRFGELFKEIRAASWRNKDIADYFAYPMATEFSGMSRDTFAKELYAQIMALHEMGERKNFRELLPKVYDAADAIQGLLHDGNQYMGVRLSGEDAGAGSGHQVGQDEGHGDTHSLLRAPAGGARPDDGGSGQEPPGRRWFGSGSDRSRRINDNVSKLPAELKDGARDAATNLQYAAKRGFYALTFGRDLADLAKATFKMLKPTEAMDVYSQMGAYKHAIDDRVGNVARDFSKLPRDLQDKVQRFLHDSNESGKWGYTPSWKDATTHKVDPEMENRLRALGQQDPKARELVQRIFDQGHELFQEKKELAQAKINEIFNASKAEATARGATPDELHQIEVDRQAELTRHGQVMVERAGPYVPSKRFGDHVVEGKSSAYLAAEAEAQDSGDYSKLTKMKADHDHYWLSFERSKAARDRAVAEVKQRYGWAEGHAKEPFMEKGMAGDPGALIKLREHALAAYGSDPKVADQMVRMINDMYIQSLGDGNARQNTRKRLGVAGVKWDERVMGFVHQGLADAHYISQMKFGEQLEKAYSGMREEARAGEDPDGKKYDILNEFQKRRLISLKENPAMPWENTALRLTSAMKLLTSPGYYLQYLSQPMTMAAPLLLARHGLKAWGELGRATMDARRMAKASGKFADADWSRHADPMEKEMLDHMASRGLITIGADSEFGRNVGLATNAGSKAFNSAMDKLSKVGHGIEMHNRIAAALAMYRMEMGRDGATHASATDAAARVISQAYGDYSAYNAPRAIMAGNGIPAIRLLSQYKKFSFIHTSLAARLLHNAFGAGTPAERRIAGKSLGYMSLHYGVLAGSLGLPGAAAFAGAAHYLNQLWNGTTDDPEDTNLWLERQIGDPDTAKLILHGLPGAAGLDFTHRMGAGDILTPFPTLDKDPTTSRDNFASDVLAMAGPFIGALLPDMARGAGQIMQGDLYGGLTHFVPSGVRDGMKAWKLANQGLVDKHGVQQLAPDSLEMKDIVGQAVGSPSLKLTQIQRGTSEMYEYTSHFKDKQNEIRSAYVRAVEDGDSDKLSDARDSWMEMQDRMRSVGMKPPGLSTLIRAPFSTAKKSRLVENGIAFSRGNRRLGQELGEEVGE